ncbi:MAG: aminopeptidase P family protein [Bdellovibrionales bacterium]
MNQEQFLQRRSKLRTCLSEGDALLLPCYPSHARNSDNMFPYRQESSLYYLTGFEEAESMALFRPGKVPEFILFVPPRDAVAELWDGVRFGVEGAKKHFGADEAHSFYELEEFLPKYLNESSKLFYQMHLNPELDSIILNILEGVRKSKGRTGLGLLPLYDSTEVMGDIRVIKSSEEIDLMRRSGKIAAEAQKEAMRFIRPGLTEKQVQGVLSYMFLKENAGDYAYPPIVATGSNATVLHYKDNNQECKDGDLLLIDAGCEYDYYASDITRTFPVNGKFTAAQKDLYQAVLNAQKATIDIIKPGITFVEVQDKAIEVISQHLKDLELFDQSVSEIIDKKLYRKYYPHNIGHWLGLDVHDRGRYMIEGQTRPLEAGMVLTIEPGIYVPKDDMDAPEYFRGTGVRIEDDILVTDNGFENLTKDVPSEISEIESLMEEKSFLNI